MHPRQFDLIAFDWDGTLFDSTKIIVRCIQAAVRDVGGKKPTDQAAAYVIGLGLTQALAHAAPDVPPEKYPELGRRYQHHYATHFNDLSLFEGVLPLLDALKARGHLLAVATGKSRRGLDDALHSAELKGVFDGSRTADETAGKPDPLMLRELHQTLTELQESIAPLASAAEAGVRVETLSLTLPLDMVVVLRGGACVLLGDLPRNSADASWHEASTRLQITLEALPAAEAEA